MDRYLKVIDVSIRSPHQSKGRPLAWLEKGRGFQVSIRSPHQSKGRHPNRLADIGRQWFQSAPLTKARGDAQTLGISVSNLSFQSAPLTKARGDLFSVVTSSCKSKFQSAPLTKARGDWFEVVDYRGEHLVSIRSPHQSKGRRRFKRAPCFFCSSFNPLPSPKQGETRTQSGVICAHYSFNPLPSPKQGETRPS